MIHFVHRMDKLNPGDMAACPMRHFFWPLRCKEHDIDSMDMRWVREDDVVILGGGGLFNCKEGWNRTINEFFARCNNVIYFGVQGGKQMNMKI